MSEPRSIPIPEGHPFLRYCSGQTSHKQKSSNRGGTNTNTGWRDLCEEFNHQRSDKALGIYRREADRHLKAILKARSFTPVIPVLAAQPKEVPADWVLPPTLQTTESCVRETVNVEGDYLDTESTTIARENRRIKAEALGRPITSPLDAERPEEYRRILFEALSRPIALLFTNERLEDLLQGLPSPLNMTAFVKARVKPLFDEIHLADLRNRRDPNYNSFLRCWELAGIVVDNIASGRAPDDVSRRPRPQRRRLPLRTRRRR
ncbi:hypothetical protein RBB50_009979 [Rhinocladiella similis]